MAEEGIATIMSLGITQDPAVAAKALEMSANSLDRAVDLILTGQVDLAAVPATVEAVPAPGPLPPGLAEGMDLDHGIEALTTAAAVAHDEDEELNRAITMSMQEEAAGTAAAAAAGGGEAGSAVSGDAADDETAQAIAMSLSDGNLDPAAASEPDGESRPTDDDIRAHWESVVGAQAENIKDKPLVGPVEPLEAVAQEYDAASNAVFVAKVRRARAHSMNSHFSTSRRLSQI